MDQFESSKSIESSSDISSIGKYDIRYAMNRLSFPISFFDTMLVHHAMRHDRGSSLKELSRKFETLSFEFNSSDN